MKRSTVFAAALALLAAGACQQDRPTGPQQSARTRVLLTDDPFPYDTVQRVDLYIESIAATTDADTSAASTWVTLAEPHARFNLLDYQDGNAALLDSVDVPAGEYRAVRVVLNTDSSRIVATTGAEMNIDWQASAGHPTLYATIERPIGIPEEGGAVVIDFDVGRSFLWQTAVNHYTFSPVLRAVEEGATGTVKGRLTDDLGSPLPFATLGAYADDGLRATARTDAAGNFTLAYLVPGSYDVRFEPQPGDPDQAVARTVTVAAGQTLTGQDLVSHFCSGNACGGMCSIEGCDGGDTTFVHCDGMLASCDTTFVPPPPPGDTTGTDTTHTASASRLVISPDSVEIAVGQTARFTAALFDSLGRTVSNPQVTWGVLDSAYVTITNDGVVTGLSAGSGFATARIIAVSGRAIDTAAVFVRRP